MTRERRDGNVRYLRDKHEDVLEALTRLVLKMESEDHTGDEWLDAGILVVLTRGGRLEVSRLGTGTSPCLVLGILDVAKDRMLDEIFNGG